MNLEAFSKHKKQDFKSNTIGELVHLVQNQKVCSCPLRFGDAFLSYVNYESQQVVVAS